ncbi:MAG: sigma 54-interacting transcriptional regulator [Pyrinomonadaceae bacterium]
MYAQFSTNREHEITESLILTGGSSSLGSLKNRQTENPKIAALDLKIERYSRARHHVLITGERGTGKTTIARQIHNKSTRRSKQFVSLNCATLKEELVESELFGYEKGAFTGANQMKAGLFETGSGGTVFLDEIGELSLNLQAKLLKAVEEKQIRRVGASRELPVDLRIIAATSRNLREMVANGEFRADLYDRLNVLGLGTIPLREQKEKIRDLVIAGLERERTAVSRRKSFQIEACAVSLLENYSWTGNFRELNNFVFKLAIEYSDEEMITFADVRALLAEKEIISVRQEISEDESPTFACDNQLVVEINPDEHLDEIIERVKERYIFHHLKDKSYRRTAEHCGISRSMIRRVADKYAVI